VVNWDDDDIYLPNHLSNHAEVINQGYAWSHPKRVYCAYNPIAVETVGGNMWASIAVSTKLLRSINLERWFENRKNAFDLEFLARLESRASPGRSDTVSFMFRWGSTEHPHLQGFIKSPCDTDAYSKFPRFDPSMVSDFQPKFDKETEAIMKLYEEGKLPCQVQ
jgi:hypothetical protein